jgi:plasmid maintenance system antidote protein VapI
MSANGEVLNEEFLTPQCLTSNAVAKRMRLPPTRTTAILFKECVIDGVYR